MTAPAEKESKPNAQMNPSGTVAIDGGDPWSGIRGVSMEDTRAIAEEAFSTSIMRPVLAQWFPRRRWLWRQWQNTIVRVVLPREVLYNMMFALVLSLWFRVPGPHSRMSNMLLDSLRGVERVWVLISGLVSFSLAFFLSQAYAMWAAVYVKTRQVQGRINDLGLLCATAAERNADGSYSDDAEVLLGTLARYMRVFNVLLYASMTRRFAPLRTPNGLSVLTERQELVLEEKEVLLESSLAHNGVFAWISSAIGAALKDGRLDRVWSRTFQAKLLDLRSTYAGISDSLSGRLPLAYTHLMQLLVDVLVATAPLALLPYTSGAVWSTVLGAGLVTLFYSSVLNLAKVFLDPFDNDNNAVKTGISINVATLMQETNLGSERWRRGAARVPSGARSRRAARPSDDAADAAAAAEGDGTDAAVRIAFSMADSRGQGDLDQPETWMALQQLGLEEDALEELDLERFDSNGDGRLDLNEFSELVSEVLVVDPDDVDAAERGEEAAMAEAMAEAVAEAEARDLVEPLSERAR